MISKVTPGANYYFDPQYFWAEIKVSQAIAFVQFHISLALWNIVVFQTCLFV
jgi:hypothetical protein